jgi:hypothetical protein
MMVKHAMAARQTTRQRRIAQVGVTCEGKVVAIQRPSCDDCTRLYFDFVPSGAESPCAVAMSLVEHDEPCTSLPAQERS